jgi:glycosyltransferase involved in cell wall biosynthesis
MSSVAGLKLLLVGPYPPPHGGISVHVQNASKLVRQAGADSKVLNVDPRAPRAEEYIKISNPTDLALSLLSYAWNGWTIHTHINGHTNKSWLIALACGLAGQNGAGGILTIHSGIAPQYLRQCSTMQRRIVQIACLQFDRIVCVNDEIATTLGPIGIPQSRIDVIPAFLPLSAPSEGMPQDLESWINKHHPILSTAMFFRPEYGFDVLISGLKTLAGNYPQIGCLVMGSGEDRMAAEMLTRKAGLTESVQFVGDIDHNMCLALMARSQVFVRPTLRDGDSISVREAVGLGIPVVASAVGTRPIEAHLFEPGKVEGMIAQIERALVLQRNPATTCVPAATVEQLLNVYSAVMRHS